MARNILYVGNERPSIAATLTDGSGTAVNLSGYTVKLALRRQYSGSSASNLFKTAATVVSASAGTVRFDPSSSSLTSAPEGLYNGQWELTDGSANVETITAGEFEIRRAY